MSSAEYSLLLQAWYASTEWYKPGMKTTLPSELNAMPGQCN